MSITILDMAVAKHMAQDSAIGGAATIGVPGR